MDYIRMSVIAIGLLSAGTCMFAGVLLGFISDELIGQRASSPLVRFTETVAIVTVLIGVGLLTVVILLGSGVLFS